MAAFPKDGFSIAPAAQQLATVSLSSGVAGWMATCVSITAIQCLKVFHAPNNVSNDTFSPLSQLCSHGDKGFVRIDIHDSRKHVSSYLIYDGLQVCLGYLANTIHLY